MLFNLFSVGGATSHHGSMFPDHSMIKWFDAVSSRFKTEANAAIFGSFHHVAAHMYDMHHRMAHSPAVDYEFSDAFFHIATLPRIAPNFGASPSFFVDYEKLFPINLTPINFDATVNDLEYFTAQVTFKFTNFKLRDKNFQLL